MVDRVPRSCFKGGVAAVTQPFDKRLAMQEGQGARRSKQSVLGGQPASMVEMKTKLTQS